MTEVCVSDFLLFCSLIIYDTTGGVLTEITMNNPDEDKSVQAKACWPRVNFLCVFPFDFCEKKEVSSKVYTQNCPEVF